MSDTWVSFSAVKSAVSMRMVVEHYGIANLKPERGELVGRCPIHKGDGDRAFHVSYEKDCFQCFSCKQKGNVLDFVAAMEQCSVRDAALKLSRWFHVPVPPEVRGLHRPMEPPGSGKGDVETDAGAPAAEEGSVVENKPLGFALKGIDPKHPYLQGRGIPETVAREFGVGFFAGRGMMSGRIVIPIRNEAGALVAYAGRAIDEAEPKYKLPAGFKKSQVLYNLDRVVEKTSSDLDGLVVVVEGFFDCIKVASAGFPCVALMGSSMSRDQEKLLLESFSDVLLMLDGDGAGQEAAIDIAGRLSRRAWVIQVELSEGAQPDSLSTEQIQERLNQLL